MKVAVKGQEIFTTLLKDAKVKSYVGEELTLEFESEYKTNHFTKYYKGNFEDTVSMLFGKQIEVIAEWSK